MKSKRRKVSILTIMFLTFAFIVSCSSDSTLKKSEWDERDANVSSNQKIFSWIKDITSFGYRRPGTKASMKSVNYIKEKFKEFGLENVHLEPHKTHMWEIDEWGLKVNNEKIECFYMPNTMRKDDFGKFSTGDNGIKAEIVYVGDGSEEDYEKVDVKGKIVMSDILFYDLEWDDFTGMSYFSHDPGKTIKSGELHKNPYVPKNYPMNYYRAQKNEAAGFIGVLVDYVDQHTYHNEDTSLSSGYKKHGYMEIPGLYVKKSVGAKLKNIISNKSMSNQGSLNFKVNIKPVVANNVLGYVPGKSDDIILIHSHHDAAFYGAVEDASGVSIVMALAEYFGRAPKEFRDKTLLFATLDTHSFGYAANKGFIKKSKEKGENIILDVCAEHIGLEAKNVDGKFVLSDSCEPRGIFVTENEKFISITRDAVIKNEYKRTVVIPTFSPLGVCSDAFYLHKSGVPVISLISGPLYIYDLEDSDDKIAVDQLRPTTLTLIDVIEEVDNMSSKEIGSETLMIGHRIKYYWWYLGKIVGYLFF